MHHDRHCSSVRDENYKEFTESEGAVVAYGLATCEPCKQYDPILEETAAKFPSIKIGKAKMHVPGRCREIKKSACVRDLSHHALLCPWKTTVDSRRGYRTGRIGRLDLRPSHQIARSSDDLASHFERCRSRDLRQSRYSEGDVPTAGSATSEVGADMSREAKIIFATHFPLRARYNTVWQSYF